MENGAKFVLALLSAAVVMLLFRMLAFTVYSIPDSGIDNRLVKGDRVMVNRWSYGLRSGDGRMFRYARLVPHDIAKGDLVAFNPPADSVLNHFVRRVCIGRVEAVPGDTVEVACRPYSIPRRLVDCPLLGDKYYLVSTSAAAGDRCLVTEKHIIGRAFLVLYSKEDTARIFGGFRKSRTFLLIK